MNRDLLRSQLLALRATVDASLVALGAEDVDEVEVSLKCPTCGNDDGDRLEDTSAAGIGGRRYTCLNCGASWTMALEVVANG